jgi:hypothetical protein
MSLLLISSSISFACEAKKMLAGRVTNVSKIDQQTIVTLYNHEYHYLPFIIENTQPNAAQLIDVVTKAKTDPDNVVAISYCQTPDQKRWVVKIR